MRCLFVLLLAATTAFTATIPEGGTNVLPADWQNAAKAQGSTKFWKTAKADFGEHGKGWRVEVFDDKAGPFQLQLTCALEGSIKSGDKVLIAFEARCVPGSTPDGKGGANVQIENKEPPNYEKLGQDRFEVRGEWETVFIPFPANASSKPGVCHASILPAGRKQTLEIANMRVLNYGAAFDLNKLPRPYIHYDGREADAPWRKEALTRIEQLRMGDLAIEVVDASGKPVREAKVNVQLKRHSFGFGTAVKAKLLMGEDERSKQYRAIVEANFSRIVLENDLKPFARSAAQSGKSKEFRDEWTLGALRWAREHGMTVRGHYLCWGPWEDWSEKLKNEPQKIREHVMQHMSDVISFAGEYATEWDAVNHPVGWSDPRSTVDQVIAPDFYADVIKAARQRLHVPLFVNEDQVFRPGRQQDEYFEAIKTLIAQGAKPDGIGNMAHFHSSFLPAPAEMLRISDRFAKLVPNLEITEFDVNTNGDEELQANWLRDMLIMAYSHPAYSGFMLWVFWEGAGWKPETALWRKDWTEKPNAKVWRDLVWNQWATNATGRTDAGGAFHARGHLGLYDITIERNGRRQTAKHMLTKDGKALRVTLP